MIRRNEDCKKHVLCKRMRNFAEQIRKGKHVNKLEPNENEEYRDDNGDKEVELENNDIEYGPKNITELVKEWTERDINEYIKLSENTLVSDRKIYCQ